MKNIGIINCYNASQNCTSSGCFKAFYNSNGAFEKYNDMEAQILSFVHCNGCSDNSVQQVLDRAERMVKRGVDVIHLSSCVKSKCPRYEEYLKVLNEKGYTVEGYTHGKKE